MTTGGEAPWGVGLLAFPSSLVDVMGRPIALSGLARAWGRTGVAFRVLDLAQRPYKHVRNQGIFVMSGSNGGVTVVEEERRSVASDVWGCGRSEK